MFKLYLDGLDIDEIERIRYPLYNETMEDIDLLDGIDRMLDGWDDEIDEILKEDDVID